MTIEAKNAPAGTKRVLKGTPRPRNRKAQILEVAREQFARSGYHGVNVEDIASAVGITAGAMYRHFPNKQALLAQVVLTAMGRIGDAVRESAPDDSIGVARAMLQFCLHDSNRVVLFDREARHLDAERRREVRDAVVGVVDQIADHVRDERPDLTAADADLIAWAMAAIALYPARNHSTVPRKRLETMLLELMERVRTAPVPRTEQLLSGPPPRGAFGVVSRREALMTAGIRLFRERGYQAVTLDDIGATAGMASSSIYTYFASKADVMQAILTRGNESLWIGLDDALATATSRDEAIEHLIRSYVATALHPNSAINILIEESAAIPPEVTATMHDAQKEYLGEWLALAGDGSTDARVRVHATIGVINDLSRVRMLHKRPHLAEDIAVIAGRVIGLPDPR